MSSVPIPTHIAKILFSDPGNSRRHHQGRRAARPRRPERTRSDNH